MQQGIKTKAPKSVLSCQYFRKIIYKLWNIAISGFIMKDFTGILSPELNVLPTGQNKCLCPNEDCLITAHTYGLIFLRKCL